ncbi:hypothetical protein MD484_g8451, partial [Candolleomyces efflorescens]
MRFVYFLLCLFVSQVYASILPLATVLSKRAGPDAATCQTCPNWATMLEQGCETATDFSCVCKPDFTSNFVTCTECGLELSGTVLPANMQQDLATGANSYLAAIVYVCKNVYNIDIPAGTVTVP